MPAVSESDSDAIPIPGAPEVSLRIKFVGTTDQDEFNEVPSSELV